MANKNPKSGFLQKKNKTMNAELFYLLCHRTNVSKLYQNNSLKQYLNYKLNKQD